MSAAITGEAAMQWRRRIRGALVMGVTFAIGWGLVGVVAEMLIPLATHVVPGFPWGWDSEPPLPALAIPGFFFGVFFSIVLSVVARRRRFSELSLPRFAVWGALAGVVLALFPLALVAVGWASLNANASAWRVLLELGIPAILIGGVTAPAALMVARKGEARDVAEIREEVTGPWA